MITADQLVAHAIGDYVLQSDWMAQRKRSDSFAAAVHAAVYTLCFLPFVAFDRPAYRAWTALVYIGFSHYLIDRYGLARYVVWAKNFLAPRWIARENDCPRDCWVCGGFDYLRNLPWSECAATGYPPDRAPFLAVWLLIIADNILHVVINGAALRWL